jgi:hypothetical protein
LLDDILEKESKTLGGLNDNKSGLNSMKKKESFDSYFDDLKPDPKPKSAEKNKLTLNDDPPVRSPFKNSFKGDQSD